MHLIADAADVEDHVILAIAVDQAFQFADHDDDSTARELPSPLRAGVSHLDSWSLFHRLASHRLACPSEAQGIASRTKRNRIGNGCCVSTTGLGRKRPLHLVEFPYAIPLRLRDRDGVGVSRHRRWGWR